MYLIRLDDASEYMDLDKWGRMEILLDRYNIKPITGVIPKNEDREIINKYIKNDKFWEKVKAWQSKGWTISLHGYNHFYETNNGGMNPVNLRSEFAGVSLERQKMKIAAGIKILKEHGLDAEIFFAPSHTFDINTLRALKAESSIRVICDTIANDIYKSDEFYFIPQQSGQVRRLPFKVTTFCYHPNDMEEQDFKILEDFIKNNRCKFISFKALIFKDRDLSLYDKGLNKLYFLIRMVRNKLRRN